VQLQAAFVEARKGERTLFLHINHISETRKISLKWLNDKKKSEKLPQTRKNYIKTMTWPVGRKSLSRISK
jgi:hypothetical protein